MSKTETVEYAEVRMPAADMDRIKTVLENLSLENKGWKRFFKRWKISDEPLRNDARELLKHILWRESREEIIRDQRKMRLHYANVPTRAG